MTRGVGFLPAVVTLVVAGLHGAPVAAQQFDNFDGQTLEGFDLETNPSGDLSLPSLGEGGSLMPIGPDISLEITDGQSDVGFRNLPGVGGPVTSISQPATEVATRITLRALDKTLGRPMDIDMAIGETVMFGRIAIHAIECRYPAEDPNSDAFAHLEIFDRDEAAIFDGWMIASSPALNALEHPRYDVWVLGCGPE